MNLTTSWKNQIWPLRILRAWLGFTWIYAGWDKANDPGFLTAGSPTYIGSQISAFATNSPIDFLLNRVAEHATQIGILIMASEFAVGAATLLWIAPTWAAFGGFLTSLTLWLASTWNVEPYFLASNSAYAITVAGVALGRFFPKETLATSGGATDSKSLQIIEDTALKVGDTYNFTSKAGTPAVLFRTKNGIFAYSAVCTHEGCTVAFNSASKNLQCACHGAAFDPFDGAKVLTGPTSQPLAKIKVATEGNWIVES